MSSTRSSPKPTFSKLRIFHLSIFTDITLNAPLEYNHHIFDFLEPSDLEDPSDPRWWNDGGHVAPEVGLLSHNIVVRGGEDGAEPLETNHYGCRLLVGRYRGGSSVYSGLLWLDSVEFSHCGQGGYFTPLDPRYSIAFRSSRDTSVGSYVRGCSIHHGYNTAVGVHGSNGVTVSENVVWRTVDSAFKIGGLDNQVLDNLAIYTTTVQPNEPPDNHAVDFPACFDVNSGNFVRGNAAAGSTRLGFRLAGEPCMEDREPPSYDQVSLKPHTISYLARCYTLSHKGTHIRIHSCSWHNTLHNKGFSLSFIIM